LELSGAQSSKSLAEIYEDEFSAERQRAEGQEVVHEKDAKLEKEHEEIRRLFDDVCGKLDALSNAHFTPKPVRPFFGVSHPDLAARADARD
jgi:U3 small nucleolar RNA-associated protein MPP10